MINANKEPANQLKLRAALTLTWMLLSTISRFFSLDFSLFIGLTLKSSYSSAN